MLADTGLCSSGISPVDEAAAIAVLEEIYSPSSIFHPGGGLFL